MIENGAPSSTRRCLIVALIAGSIVFGTEQAKADRPAICSKSVSTPELNLCRERAWQQADTELNAAFGTALGVIRKTTSEEPYDRANWDKALRASQRAWIIFRNADCRGLVPMRWSGGTGTTSAVLECMTTKTRIRTRELLGITERE